MAVCCSRRPGRKSCGRCWIWLPYDKFLFQFKHVYAPLPEWNLGHLLFGLSVRLYIWHAYRILGIFRVGLIFAEFSTSLKLPKIDTAKNKPYYRISGNFREDLIFAIFANELKTRKYVSAKNCTLKESLQVVIGMIFCCIPCLIWNPDVNQETGVYNYYTNNLYKPASLIWWPKPMLFDAYH